MPRTSRKPFRNHLFVVEINNRVKVDGQFQDAWEYESTVTGQLIPGSTVMRGVQYEKANDSVQHKIMFRDDPHLTVNHRLIYLGRTLHFRGVTQPMEAGRLWEVFVEESTAEQASQFMRMEGMGITGVANMVHVMSGGMLLGGEDYFDDEFSTSSSSSSSTSSSSSSSTRTASSSSSGSSGSTESSSHSSSTSSSSSTSGSSSSNSSSSSSTPSSGSSSSSSTGTVTSQSLSSQSSSSSSTSSASTSSSSLV